VFTAIISGDCIFVLLLAVCLQTDNYSREVLGSTKNLN
jgi:hypothetical protein